MRKNIFSVIFEGVAFLKKLKNICQVNAFDLFFHLVYFLKCYVHVVCSKNAAKNIFPIFFAIFALFKLQKALILVFLFQKCHQNGYWMLLTYISFILIKRDLFLFLFFWIFLQILNDISNSSIFRPICVYNFFCNLE